MVKKYPNRIGWVFEVAGGIKFVTADIKYSKLKLVKIPVIISIL